MKHEVKKLLQITKSNYLKLKSYIIFSISENSTAIEKNHHFINFFACNLAMNLIKMSEETIIKEIV